MSDGSSDARQWTPRRVVLATLVVVAVIAGFWALYHFRLALVLLFTALVVSTSLRPIVARLRQAWLPRAAAATLVHLAALGLFSAVLVWMLPLIIQQTTAFLGAIPDQYDALRAEMLQSPNGLVRRLAEELPPDVGPLVERPATEEPLGEVAEIWGVLRSILWGMFLVLAVFLLSVYWTIEDERIIRSLLLLLPLEKRDAARELVVQIQEKLGAFVVGQSLLCLAVGLMALVAYWLIGLPYVLVLALIAGVFEAIPNIGPILGAIPAILVGLTVGPMAAFWVIVANVFITLAENYLLTPRIMDESVGVHPVVTLLAITALVAAVGVLGGILAIPLAAVVQVLLNRFVFAATPSPVAWDDRRDRVGVLKYQAQEILEDLRHQWRQLPQGPQLPLADHAEQAVEKIVLDLNRALEWTAEQRRKP